MVGRSNVGKSSLINALVKQKIARTSAAPGKTRLVNYYLIDSALYWSISPATATRAAATSLSRRSSNSRGVFDPSTREQRRVAGVLQLVDSRHHDLPQDAAGYAWLLAAQAPVAIVATKIDKLNRSEQSSTMRSLKESYDSPVLPVSAFTGDGLNEIWKLLRQWTGGSRKRESGI